MPDNHKVHDMDALATRIRKKISESGVCELRRPELAALWGDDKEFSDLQRRMCIENFADHYGFFVLVDHALSCAMFR